MAKADGSVIIDTKINTDGFGKGAANLKGQFGDLGSSLKKLSKLVAAAFSVKVLVDFGKKAIELGSDLQEVQNVVDVTFATMNEQVNEFARNAATTAGLSETMAKQYTGTFGAMAKSFGFTEEEAYDMSTALTQLSGDVASFYNLSQDAAYTKLKSVFTGETESLKDLGVVMTQTALDDFALRKGLSKTTSQMSEQEKVALRYQFIMEQLSAASGDFVRTQDSWANQTRVLNLQFEQLKATIGQGLINALTPVLKIVNNLIVKLQEFAVAFKNATEALFGNASAGSSGGMAESLGGAADKAENLEENITQAGKAAKKAVAGFDELNVLTSGSKEEESFVNLPNVASGGGPISLPIDISVTDNASAKMVEIANKIKSVFSQIQTEVNEKFAPSISSWGDAFKNLLPSIQTTAGEMSRSVSQLWDNSLAPFGNYIANEFVPDIANKFSTTFAPIFSEAMPVMMDSFATDFKNTSLIVSESTGWMQEGFEKTKTVFWDMCDSIKSNWETYGGSLLQGFTDFKDGLWETFWSIYDDTIKPVLDNCSKMFDWLWTEHLKPLWDSIVEFAMSVADNALALWNKCLKPIIDWLWERVSPIVTNVINGIVDFVALLVARVSDAIKAIIKVLDGVITFLVGVFTLDFKRAWEGIKKIFEGVWDGIKGAFTGTVNGIIWVINQMIAAIYSGIASAVNGVGSIVEKFGDLLGKDWGFEMPTVAPKIPYLAKGAVIPPNAPFMAMLGDQRHGTNIEAPLETIKQALAEVLAMQGGGETNVNVTFTGDLAQLARVLKPAIETETRRKGGSLAKGATF